MRTLTFGVLVLVLVSLWKLTQAQETPLQSVRFATGNGDPRFFGFGLSVLDVFGASPFGQIQLPTELQWRQVNSTFSVINPVLKAGYIGYYGSPCDVPSLQTLYFSHPDNLGTQNNTIEDRVVNVGDTYVLYQPSGISIEYIAFVWISQNSFFEGGNVEMYYRSFIIGTGQNALPSATLACSSTMTRVYPSYGFQNAFITITGTNFGLNADDILIHIGDIICGNVEVLAPQTVVGCVAIGNGTDLPISMTFTKTNRTASGDLRFFFETCLLSCLNGGLPDDQCETCVCPAGTVGADCGQIRSTVIPLEDLISLFQISLIDGQYASDTNFIKVAQTYQGTLLEEFPIPRYVLPLTNISIPVALVAIEPEILVAPLTADLAIYDANKLVFMNFTFESEECIWNKIVTPDQLDSNGNKIANASTTYKLDYLG